MIQKESNFNPPYRYEPFDDMRLLQNFNEETGKYDYELDEFSPYRILSSTDKGTPEIPTNHTNLYTALGRINGYPGYKSIWDYYWENISMYGISITNSKGETNYIYSGDKKEKTWEDECKKASQELYEKKPEELTSEQFRVASDSTDARFFRWVRYEHHSGMENKVAQTRIMASYGLLQLVYFYADTRDYPKNNTQYLPEDINDNSKGLEAGIKHFKRKLNEVLKNKFDNPTWESGLEKAYYDALILYNTSDSYRKTVKSYIPDFLPRQ
jgi:hypothetical protein